MPPRQDGPARQLPITSARHRSALDPALSKPAQPGHAPRPVIFRAPSRSGDGRAHASSPCRAGPASQRSQLPSLPAWAAPHLGPAAFRYLSPLSPARLAHPAPHIPVPARTAAHSAPVRSRSAAASADSPAPPVRTSSLLPFPAPRNRARNGRRDHRGSLSPARMPRSRHPFKLTPRPPCASSSTNAPPLTLAAPPPPSSAAKGPLRRRGFAAPP